MSDEKERRWGYASDAELTDYTGGFQHKGEAIAAGFARSPSLTLIYVAPGERPDAVDFFPDTAMLLENATDHAEEEWGDRGKKWLTDIPLQAHFELDEYIANWVEKHVPPLDVWLVEAEDAETFTRAAFERTVS